MFTTRPELIGTHGMVASTHWLASAAGMAVLEDGGNAFDAAVAAGFTLQVVEPHLNGPGGEVPAIFATAGGQPQVLCGQGVAPAGATLTHYRGLGLELVPGTGLLAATIPGAWDGWLLLLRDHGTRTLRQVLDYAIGYARNGFPVVERITATIEVVERLFREHWPTSAAQWLPAARPGARLRNPALADTLERLLAEAEAIGSDREAQIEAARRAWYQGFVAEEIDSFARQAFRDDSGRSHAGVLTAADLAGWSASYDTPISVDLADDWTLHKIGRWSQGPVLAQQLRLLDGADLSYVDGVASVDTVHQAVEAAKLAFADREAWYGDSADVPLDRLLSAEYANQRRALIGETASLELRPGLDGRLPAFVAQGRGIGNTAGEMDTAMGVGEPTVARTGLTRGDTVHVDVLDRWGNLISATPSGGWLQSSPHIPALGFNLGTRAQMFWLDEGHPNVLAPGKRPRITLTPSLASRHGEPVLAFGTPGGDQQDQWQLCFWLAHTRAGLNLQEAIDAPAWHSTAFPASFYPRNWQPGELVAESRLGAATFAELARRGHSVLDAGPWALGRLSAVSRDPDTGLLRGAANARGAQGYAVGR
ncbi:MULTISPECIES: gamma-glutamyltransferase family protein [unclassified Crossiella]|uniref:gamma-glutamyltransferase family protein n=1 Tax=unclassified Crossiella TaxID=2620835 RepID=UPI001FFEDBB0|nr:MULTISPECIES: gamma-glutamyltransferase family protein [unclassified Crossiella]MCK2245172.1 gamma-glutamyltransferase family protein [Crossiella sp. S99.2]MCK2258825.1 gamma-glutamyltransferase family protein [Crossiella sp. S99.1]